MINRTMRGKLLKVAALMLLFLVLATSFVHAQYGTGLYGAGQYGVDAGSSSTINAGDHIRLTAPTIVRATRATGATALQTQPAGAMGYVKEGETDASGETWIRVNFKRGYDGYIIIDTAEVVAPPTLASYTTVKELVSRGTATTTLSHKGETDLNGDTIDDREELRIATLRNKVRADTDRFNSLVFNGERTEISRFVNQAESEVKEKEGRSFPVGLFDFTATVESGATETVTIYLDTTYDTSAWVYEKYDSDSDSYTDITSSVTFGTAAVDGETVTTVQYDITDNGALDDDPRLGFIADPAGPSIEGGSEEESSSGGGGSSGGSSGSSSSGSSSSGSETGTSASTTTETATIVTPPQASVSLPSWFTFENNISFAQPEFNQPTDVQYLSVFLNETQGEQLTVDATYDYLDVQAVQRFQEKYRREILEIWNLTEATGFVGITTRLKMNSLLLGQAQSCPVFTEYNGGRDGVFRSSEVKRTQEVLIDLDLLSGSATGYWDPLTHEAMVDFQELFHEVMLDPWNIDKGTGYKYKTTNKFLNYLVGCDTPPVELEGVGSYDF